MGSNRNYIFMLTFDSLGGPLLSHLLPPSLPPSDSARTRNSDSRAVGHHALQSRPFKWTRKGSLKNGHSWPCPERNSGSEAQGLKSKMNGGGGGNVYLSIGIAFKIKISFVFISIPYGTPRTRSAGRFEPPPTPSGTVSTLQSWHSFLFDRSLRKWGHYFY